MACREQEHLGAVHKCQRFYECSNHILSETPPPPPKEKSTHQHFLSAKIPHENNKNQAKKLTVYGKNLDFQIPHQKCMVCGGGRSPEPAGLIHNVTSQ